MSEPLLGIYYDGGPQLRVLEDGRFELKASVEPGLDPRGRAQLRQVEPAWREQWTFTPDELVQVRRAVAETLASGLRDSYEGAHNGDRVRWELRAGGDARSVEVTGTRVPQLERLFARLHEIHRVPGETTVWRLAGVEKAVPCEASAVPVLRPLVGLLFSRALGERREPASPFEGDPLVEISFRRDGEEVDRSTIFPDGRWLEVRDGRERERDPLDPQQLEALRRALDATDWAALPERLC
jgi:hypothetical protein